jgi:hypothetical protein
MDVVPLRVHVQRAALFIDVCCTPKSLLHIEFSRLSDADALEFN